MISWQDIWWMWNLRAGRCRLKFQPCHFLFLWPWPHHLTFWALVPLFENDVNNFSNLLFPLVAVNFVCYLFILSLIPQRIWHGMCIFEDKVYLSVLCRLYKYKLPAITLGTIWIPGEVCSLEWSAFKQMLQRLPFNNFKENKSTCDIDRL